MQCIAWALENWNNGNKSLGTQHWPFGLGLDQEVSLFGSRQNEIGNDVAFCSMMLMEKSSIWF